MEHENLISPASFCHYHQVDITFINSLEQSGLISFVMIEEAPYIPLEQLSTIEKIIRLHYDLDINIEGIEAISHLLDRLHSLQQEVRQLQNRLNFSEKINTL